MALTYNAASPWAIGQLLVLPFVNLWAPGAWATKKFPREECCKLLKHFEETRGLCMRDKDPLLPAVRECLFNVLHQYNNLKPVSCHEAPPNDATREPAKHRWPFPAQIERVFAIYDNKENGFILPRYRKRALEIYPSQEDTYTMSGLSAMWERRDREAGRSTALTATHASS